MGRIGHPSCFISLNVRLIFTPSHLSRHEPLSFLPDPRSSAIHRDYCFPCPSIFPPPPPPAHQASCFKRARCCLSSKLSMDRVPFLPLDRVLSRSSMINRSPWDRPKMTHRIDLKRLFRPPFLSLNRRPTTTMYGHRSRTIVVF